MLTVTTILSNSITVRSAVGESTFNYAPLDLGGLSVKEAFALGMAYCLLENRGMPIPQVPTTETTIDRHPDSEEI